MSDDNPFEKFNAWLLWKKEHPGGKFSEWYVTAMDHLIKAGKPVSCLGPDPTDQELMDKNAEKAMAMLMELGLSSSDRLVEYGCGSLSLARPILEYLDPGHYIGLDITDRFYSYGKARYPDLVARKQPQLAVITPEALDRVRAQQPRFVIAFAVVGHVAPGELDYFFTQFIRLLEPGAVGLVEFKEGERDFQHWYWDFTYRRSTLSAAVERAGGVVESNEKHALVRKYEEGDTGYLLIGQK
ncbi:MAG: class I SAM-dependent methyltransferase [Proteobacteria bacterium]|nr:class I SAM-dependent methyltransferase [Pseudomonadota bacterium]